MINTVIKLVNIIPRVNIPLLETSAMRDARAETAEDKKKELQEFIMRFSANASKSKQATARKKMLDKIDVETIKASTRRYPALIWDQEREAGDQILEVDNLTSSNEEGVLLNNLSFRMAKGDKIMFYSKDSKITTSLFQILEL